MCHRAVVVGVEGKVNESLDEGASAGVIIGAAVIVLISVSVGLWRLDYMNRFDSEYALALRLGRALTRFHGELALNRRLCGSQMWTIASVRPVAI
jgi:hypothetical protein